MSQTVDKRHAVVTFDHYLNKFKIKDLSTLNGTFVNESRLPEQEYVILGHMDSVRLGYDSMVYHMEQTQDLNAMSCAEHITLPPANEMPLWASREGPPIAECQGCIAEQRIRHTCDSHSHSSHDDKDDKDDNVDRLCLSEDSAKPAYSNVGSNTWPRKRIRQTQNIATFFTQELVTDFDSQDNNNEIPSAYEGDENGGYFDYLQNRVARGGSALKNLPPELETVKKGTPLYGQPSWWGEEEDPKLQGQPENSSQLSDDQATQAERPSSLILDNMEINAKYKTDPKYGPVYMEIPHKDTPGLEKRGMTTSMSKDSLSHDTSALNTPETPHNTCPTTEGETTLEKDRTPTNVQSPKPPGGSTISMAFTVDFDDDAPKMNMSGSLSQFMPTKIRKSFRDRLKGEKTPNRSSLTEDSEEISPTSQKKLDAIWNTPVEFHGSKKPRHTDGGQSGKSSENEDDRRDVDTVPVKGPKSQKRKSTSLLSHKPKSSKTKSADTSSVPPLPQVTDSASYLIDRMFHDGQNLSLSKVNEKSDIVDPFSEYALYKEAKEFDLEYVSKSANKSSNSKPKSKKPLKDSVPVEKKDKSDKVVTESEVDDHLSEAGTYTIELDEEDKGEEEEARQSIDHVFGVSALQRPVVNGEVSTEQSEEGEITLEDLELEIARLEKENSEAAIAESLEVEVGSDALQELRIEEDDDNPATTVPDDAPKWVSQWAALTSQKAQDRQTGRMDPTSPSSPHSKDEREKLDSKSSSSAKARSGLSRKRPGTGRKLPSLPFDKSSPASSDYSSKFSESTSESPRANDFTPKFGESISNSELSTSRQKAVTISSQVSARYEDTDSESVSLTKFGSDTNSIKDSTRTPKGSSSSRSNGSIDTELLLQDTKAVMAAMEARVESKSHKNGVRENGYLDRESGEESDSETFSMVAMVNGDEDYIKPSHYKSPRENLAKTRGKSRSVSSPSQASRTPSKPSASRQHSYGGREKKTQSYKDTVSVVSDIVSEPIDTPRSVQSDGSTSYTELSFKRSGSKGKGGVSMTRSDVADVSVVSDVGSDYSESSDFNRKGSKGKGTITMTRPNRAFQLRRARADNAETSDTPRSGASVASSNVSTGSRISSSLTNVTNTGRSSGRPKSYGSYGQLDSSRTDASLGGQIVQKSRENQRNPPTNLARADGGRHSLRMQRTNTAPESIHTDTGNSSRKSDLKNLKSQLKSTSKNYGLTVTGVSASKSKEKDSSSRSQPSSRSNSPKSAERNAWKRRKEYDPRKAVAEAKAAKAKDTKSKPETITTGTRKKMIRSRSFANSTELTHLRLETFRTNSTSSADDLSQFNNEANDTFDEHGIKRGFVPYSGRSQSCRLYPGTEEEVPSTVRSTQSYDNIIVSSIYQLSLKLRKVTDRTLDKLRESERVVSGSPSPIDDFLNHSTNSEFPAWKSANQELAGILRNLRRLEHHVHIIDRVLFPDEDSVSESSTSRLSSHEKKQYLQEIERIRSELSGFQPIDTPAWKQPELQDNESVESDCEELGDTEFF